jgi:hypothetical protein
MRVIFPVGDLSSNVHISGRPMYLFKSLKNNRLFCCMANPFLDTQFRQYIDTLIRQTL